MQLVEHGLLPSAAAPGRMLPAIGARIDDQAGIVHVASLSARRRIGHGEPVGQPIAIARPCPARRLGLEPALGIARHRHAAQAFDLDRHLPAGREPTGESAYGPDRPAWRRTAGRGRRPVTAGRSLRLLSGQHDAARRRSTDRRCFEVALRRIGLGAVEQQARRPAGRRQAKELRSSPVALKNAVRIEIAPSPLRPARRSTRRSSFGIVPGIVGDQLAGGVEPGDVADALDQLVLAMQEARRAQHRVPVAQVDDRGRRSRARSWPPRPRPASSRTTRSRCPGSRRCCCPSGCGRTRRRPAAWACPAPGTRWRAARAAGAGACRGWRDRRSAPRRPSWPSSCRRGRRCCPRRWPRCGARRSSPCRPG